MNSNSDTRQGKAGTAGGRAAQSLSGPTFEQIRKFWHPLSVENALAPYQIASSLAYVQVLMHMGELSQDEAARLTEGLRQIYRELLSGTSFLNDNDPDIYTGLARRLSELCGETAGCISRRSSVESLALDVRLWVRDRLVSAFRGLIELRQVLLRLAAEHEEVLMPGHAHLQPTRPQLLSLFFMGSESRLHRDFNRMEELFERLNMLPKSIGGDAQLEREFDYDVLSRLLKFQGTTHVAFAGDGDYLLEFASLAAITGVHLSQLASELLIWSSHEFGYVRLPRAFVFREQRFPARRNPEILEALRSRSALFAGRLAELLSIMKGIPLGYSHEANEALPAVLDVVTNLDFVLELSSVVLPALVFDTKKMSDAAQLDLENRGNVIDYLIEKDFPQEKATAIVEHLLT